MRRLLFGLLAVFMAAGLSFMIALPVGAQEVASSDEAASDEFILEEITVTAQKTEENLQKVSRSMAVISAADLSIRQTEDIQQVLQNTSGLSFLGGPYTQIMVRGMGTYTRDVGMEPSVQFNVDGTVDFSVDGYTKSPMVQATNDVERVEVIRGPSGSVNGRSAAAGTVNVISKSPDFEKVDGNASITIGNYDTIRTSAAANFPLKLTGLDLPSYLENLSFRVALSEDKHEGYVHNEKGEPTGAMQDSLSQRYRLKWQPIEPLTINLIFSVLEDASQLSASVPAIEEDAPGIFGYPGPFSSLAHPDDPWLNTGATAYGRVEAQNKQYTQSAEITYETNIGTFTGRYGYSWVPVKCTAGQANCYEGDLGQRDFELRLNSPEDSNIKWNVGGYLFHKKEYAGPDDQIGQVDPDTKFVFAGGGGDANSVYGPADRFRDFNLPTFDPTSPNPGMDVNDIGPILERFQPFRSAEDYQYAYIFTTANATRPIDAWSVFANTTIPLFEERHRLVAGLRYNYEEKKRMISTGVFSYDEDGTNNGYPHFTFEYNEVGDTSKGQWVCDNCYLVAAEEPEEHTTDDGPINWTLGWEYDWSDEVMLYVMASNGFKPGGYSPMSTPNVYYEPEKVTNYAVGMKSRWFDQRLQLNIEAFYMDYDNFQINMSTNDGPVTYAIDGVEYTQPYIAFSPRTYNFEPMVIPGLDIDYDWLITPVDRLKGNMEFKHGRFSDVYADLGNATFPADAPRYPDFDGRPIPFSPDFTFYGSYTHMFNVGGYSVTPQLDARFSSKYFLFSEYWWGSVNPEDWQDAYWKLDAFLNMGPQDGTWNLSFYCKNLTEEVIRDMSFFVGVGIEAPRTYGASFKVRF